MISPTKDLDSSTVSCQSNLRTLNLSGSDRQTFENLRPKKPVEPFELRCFPQLAASEAKIPPRIPRMPAPPRNVTRFLPANFFRPQDNGQRGGFGNVANGEQYGRDVLPGKFDEGN